MKQLICLLILVQPAISLAATPGFLFDASAVLAMPNSRQEFKVNGREMGILFKQSMSSVEPSHKDLAQQAFKQKSLDPAAYYDKFVAKPHPFVLAANEYILST